MKDWAATTGGPSGATMPTAALWRLAQYWFEGRMATTWMPRTVDESQRLLSAAGFVGPFWSIRGDV